MRTTYKIVMNINNEDILIEAHTIEEISNKINENFNIDLVSKYMVANWVNKNRIKSKKYDFININKITA